MTATFALGLTTIAAPAMTVACPRCAADLPLTRPVRAGRLRCPASGCDARLSIRAGRVLAG